MSETTIEKSNDISLRQLVAMRVAYVRSPKEFPEHLNKIWVEVRDDAVKDADRTAAAAEDLGLHQHAEDLAKLTGYTRNFPFSALALQVLEDLYEETIYVKEHVASALEHAANNHGPVLE